MDFSFIVSEDRIKKAYEDGEFDHLPGYGKPLKPDELAGLPEEIRMAYRMMKNAGFTPEESVLRQEVMTIEDLIRNCHDESERERLNRQLNEKLLHYNRMISKRGMKTNSSIFKNYEQKIEKKLFK
ncbi:DUF1992 domain-containing protein [Mesobacillus maritimus]|uniref:DnaJ family domain-containing protein n=1 Tax=Mesobacillus maritimus TaxID=1643336 RepID=UPI002040B643|nr:DUF1992 domain-containing protein [Mesobacillus maritimus]MCM3585532.1 DUF1992 domain-containing protein [Mesobacillus maritimus]